MGRTYRHRKRIKDNPSSKSLENDQNLIKLKIWLKNNNWINSSDLRIHNFIETGRGVCSKNNIKIQENLIEIPFELMISLVEIEKLDLKNFLGSPLTIHELLAIFLVLEKHKGEKSKWTNYIKSLPVDTPVLPMFMHNNEMQLLPPEMFKEVLVRKRSFQASWERVKKSISQGWKCLYCKKGLNCVLDIHSFIWSYVMVNTRAVYVDPAIVLTQSDNSLSKILSDDPSMALCPFLDMFNHSPDANTLAILQSSQGKCTYKLSTLTPYKKYEQIFISYGAHDNIKLLCEYGFFIPRNKFDVFRINFEEIIKILNFNSSQYKYIKEKCFNTDLYISFGGLSFNLKAVLFVGLRSDLKDWSTEIYSENYTRENLFEMLHVVRNILEIELKIPKLVNECSKFMKIFIDYLNYVSTYKKSLLDNLHNSCFNEVV